jgi:hypothetical protein
MKPFEKEMRVSLQYEGDDGEYNKDYHEPLCDGHAQSSIKIFAPLLNLEMFLLIAWFILMALGYILILEL